MGITKCTDTTISSNRAGTSLCIMTHKCVKCIVLFSKWNSQVQFRTLTTREKYKNQKRVLITSHRDNKC